MKSGRNTFLTGAAGAGKTYVLQQFIDWALEKGEAIAITASTGIAATHIGGQTIHSFSGIGIDLEIDPRMFESWTFKRFKAPNIKKAKILVIDEISMLKRQQFEMVDQVFKKVRNNYKPFGGVQVILCGDFFQLPPISRRGEGPSQFAVESPAWRDADFAVCYLTEQHRQSDDYYNDLLECIRGNDVQNSHRKALEERVDHTIDDMNITNLYTTNQNVENYNLAQLSKIGGQEFNYYMRETGSERNIASLKRNCLAPETLKLKEGALVMSLKNDPEGEFVNGSIGVVIDFLREEKDKNTWPVVEFFNGNTVKMYPDSWDLLEGEKIVAKLTQVPLRLAWAITVHKSQGMTLDRAHIDLRRAFEPGMGYVALSRLRTMEGLTLKGFNEVALKVSDKALLIDEGMRRRSDEIEKEFSVGTIKIEQQADEQ